MRRVPTGVAVVTVDGGGQRLGITVASLVTLSLEPPLVGVAVAQQAAMHELLREAGGFSVSVLAAGQADVAQHFARGVPPIAMWEGIGLAESESSGLHLAGAVGWLDCRVAGELPAGSHTFFVGEVLHAEHGDTAEPLLRLGGEYR